MDIIKYGVGIFIVGWFVECLFIKELIVNIWLECKGKSRFNVGVCISSRSRVFVIFGF